MILFSFLAKKTSTTTATTATKTTKRRWKKENEREVNGAQFILSHARNLF